MDRHIDKIYVDIVCYSLVAIETVAIVVHMNRFPPVSEGLSNKKPNILLLFVVRYLFIQIVCHKILEIQTMYITCLWQDSVAGG